MSTILVCVGAVLLSFGLSALHPRGWPMWRSVALNIAIYVGIICLIFGLK